MNRFLPDDTLGTDDTLGKYFGEVHWLTLQPNRQDATLVIGSEAL